MILLGAGRLAASFCLVQAAANALELIALGERLGDDLPEVG